MFLRLGFTAFGGPAAHVALMERELVDRRGWLTRDEATRLQMGKTTAQARKSSSRKTAMPMSWPPIERAYQPGQAPS